MKNLKQVLIFAAGRGKRMRPLTDKTPKPLIEVSGKSLLDRAIDNVLKINSIERIVINAFYLSNLIEKHIDNLNNPKIILSKEVKKIETGGGLLQALPLFDLSEPILLINSDVIWEDDRILPSMIDAFDTDKMDLILGLKQADKLPGYEGKGDFYFDKKSHDIFKSDDNSKISHVFTGIQIIHPRILTDCPIPPFSMNHFFKKAQQQNGHLKGLKGLEIKGDMFHVGTVEAIEMTEKCLVKR